MFGVVTSTSRSLSRGNRKGGPDGENCVSTHVVFRVRLAFDAEVIMERLID